MKHIGVIRLVVCLIVPWVLASNLSAEVVDVQATCETKVTELILGEQASSDISTESFPEPTPTLPLHALAGLGIYTTEQVAISAGSSGGRGISDYYDPTLSGTSNPAEFGLEADSFSYDSSVAYEILSTVAEYRDLNMSAADLNVNSNGQEKSVKSSVFVSGAILIWGNQAGLDLSGLGVEFDFTIVHQTVDITSTGTQAGPETTVFDAHVTVEGTSGGQISTHHPDSIEVTVGTPALLMSSGEIEAAIAVAELESLGLAHLIILPQQRIEYEYTAVAGKDFRLSAYAYCKSVNLPGGTGVAAVFGRPFESLADLIKNEPKISSGERIQAVVNKTIEKTKATPDEPTSSAPICGLLGLETVALTLLGLFLMCTRHRK